MGSHRCGQSKLRASFLRVVVSTPRPFRCFSASALIVDTSTSLPWNRYQGGHAYLIFTGAPTAHVLNYSTEDRGANRNSLHELDGVDFKVDRGCTVTTTKAVHALHSCVRA